jgi:alkylation response protein AidB-like acyl-CoA dehydrogenase
MDCRHATSEDSASQRWFIAYCGFCFLILFTNPGLVMNLNLSVADSMFRDEVQAFLARALPADIRDKVLNGWKLERDDYVRWQKILFAQGWGGSSWPQQFGGTGWTAVQNICLKKPVPQRCATPAAIRHQDGGAGADGVWLAAAATTPSAQNSVGG